MINDYKSNLESLMLSYYVKYDRLKPMIDVSFDKYNPQTVNLFIDIYDLLKPVYTREVYANKKFVIVSYIINLVAHYRNYFATRHGVGTRIYLIYANGSSPSHRTFVPEFGDDAFKETLNFNSTNKFIQDQLKLVKILAAYINDVYFVEKASTFSMFVQDIISHNPNVPCVVVTKSSYAIQLAVFNKNAIVVRPKKFGGEDQSYFISYNTAIPVYYNKISSEKTIRKILDLNPELLSVLITLTGMTGYNIKSVANTTQAVNMVHDAVINNRIINGYNNDIDFVYDNLNGIQRFIDKTNFKFRFCAMDLIYQYRIYENSPESKDTTWLVNFYDPATLKEINDHYFVDNPLDLESL